MTILGAAGFLTACGPGASRLAGPAPRSSDERGLPPVVVVDELEADNAADEAVLNAIRELEFGSLAKGGAHVRGVLTARAVEEKAAPTIRTRGGASRVTYDLPIEAWVDHQRVQYYIDYFLDAARDRFEIWMSRLPRYQGMIRARLRHHGVPEDLLYLALIESGYSNTAVSRASAVGMWQFIRSTGRQYDLRIDDWVDERRDPFMATDAAARHLRDLHERFGSWYLAAAAYNGGPTRVERALSQIRNQILQSDEAFFTIAERRYLRSETRDYVPKLIAATVIGKSAEQYGLDSIPAMTPFVFDEIRIPGQTGLDVLAELADTTTRDMIELNPHFFRGATPPNENVIVRVPRGTAQMVLERYEQLPVSERVNFIEHRIQRGETLSLIAQRYRVRLRYVQEANPGLNPQRLRIGQRLIVPISRAAQTGRMRSGVTSPPVQREAAPSSGIYRVRSGDSLWRISQRFGITVYQLRAWNQIPENVSFLEVGQRLRVTSQN